MRFELYSREGSGYGSGRSKDASTQGRVLGSMLPPSFGTTVTLHDSRSDRVLARKTCSCNYTTCEYRGGHPAEIIQSRIDTRPTQDFVIDRPCSIRISSKCQQQWSEKLKSIRTSITPSKNSMDVVFDSWPQYTMIQTTLT